MNMMDFMSDDFKEEQRNKKIEYFKSLGLDEYAIQRKMEQEELSPDKLDKMESVDNGAYKEVSFYLTNEEYEKFTEVFEILEYVKINSNQNWLLMGFVELLRNGNIMMSVKDKKVWVN